MTFGFLFSGNKCNTLTKSEVSKAINDDGNGQTKKRNIPGLVCTQDLEGRTL